MNISEIRVKLMPTPKNQQDKLRAFCSVTFEHEFVVRDLKIIDGAKGLFIAMPSRKLMSRCPSCSGKNAVRSRYCCECGRRLPPSQMNEQSETGASRRLYADIAHPINASARDKLHRAVVEAYEAEFAASKKEGYVPPRFDDLDYDLEAPAAEKSSPAAQEKDTLRHRPTDKGVGPSPTESTEQRELGASG